MGFLLQLLGNNLMHFYESSLHSPLVYFPLNDPFKVTPWRRKSQHMKDFLIEKYHLYYLLVAVSRRDVSAFIVYSSESTWNSRRKSLRLSLWNAHPWGFCSTNEANCYDTKHFKHKVPAAERLFKLLNHSFLKHLVQWAEDVTQLKKTRHYYSFFPFCIRLHYNLIIFILEK